MWNNGNSYTACRSVKWYGHFGNQFGNSQILNMELLYDAAIVLVGMNPRKMKTCSHKNLYMNVHSIVIHNRQKVETSDNQQMNDV